MKFILGWIKTHLVASITISTIVVGTAVATPIVLMNSEPSESSNEVTESIVEDKEPELNEDGCPVGQFKNYYGICQDEHAYDPQECPDGYIWGPQATPEDAFVDVGNNEFRVDYSKVYGIDGLVKGSCVPTYETMCKHYAETPGAAPCSTTKYGLEEKHRYEVRDIGYKKCGRGFSYNDEYDVCVDMSAYHRNQYERLVLGWDVPEADFKEIYDSSLQKALEEADK